MTLCTLLAVPYVGDWLTQSWGLRQSNNGLRLLTGAVTGVGISLFSSIDATPGFKTMIYVSAAALIAIFGSAGKLIKKPPSKHNMV